ncbi:MAG: biosynthetic-type acetolactate synthase large subunit [Clostridia bacterium]|nr:biosynthetic-type acetolactate synthase large subunit [Clostridia bacterium]
MITVVLTGSEILIETLIEQGVDTVFGYPGGNVLKIYDELYKTNKIKHITTAHEQGACHAADGYARTTGKTGVVIATSGPGATNLVTGIATAALDSTPLVAICGNVSTSALGKDSFQEVDIMGVTLPITKHNYIVKDINELADTIREAFLIASSGRCGPVLIDIPQDVQFASCEFEVKEIAPPLPVSKPSADEISRAVDMINFSKRPFIYAGGGVVLSGACDELIKLSEVIDAPVGTSMMGLTSIPRNHENFVGMTGMHGRYAATNSMMNADLIIACGTRFSDRATGNKSKFAANIPILHIDIDQSEINKNIRSTHSLVGDLKYILPLIIDSVDKKKRPLWHNEIQQYKEYEASKVVSSHNTLNPKNIIEEIQKYTNEDTVIVTDVGQHQMWTAQFYDFNKPRTLLTSGGLGTMGFGLGAAIGSSISLGGKTTVLITGDGSFHMDIIELATAVEYNLPIKIFIINNNALGMVKQWQSIFYDHRYSCTLQNKKTDFVLAAKAFGASGFKASSVEELHDCVKQAFAADGVSVVDCTISPDECVLPMIPPNGSISDIIM